MKFVDALVKKCGPITDHSCYTHIWADPLKEWLENRADVTEQVKRIWGETKTCPNCGQLVGTPYCPVCGTKIKWEAEQEREMAKHDIYILSDIRAGYSLFDNEEWEYYHALSEAIDAIKQKYNLI